MRLFAVFLLVTITVAGCAGKEKIDEPGPTSAECLEQGLILGSEGGKVACIEPPFVIEQFEDANHYCVVNQQRDRVHAPDLVGNPWTLGQFWNFRLVVDGDDLGVTKLVYYADQDFSGDVPQHYMVGTPTREEALHHALNGENPMIGRVHRVLYSPHESGDHADMFHFPLCAGSEWTTKFYGETFTLNAQAANITVPGKGQSPGFLIQGTSSEGGKLSLSYSPEAQWFTFINLTRADGGTVLMNLEEVGQGYRGDAFFLRGQQDEFTFMSGTAPATPAMAALETMTINREDGGDGPYDTIGLDFVYGLQGAGAMRFEIVDPTGAVAFTDDVTATSGSNFSGQVLEIPYQAGDWTISLTGAGADPELAFVFAHLNMVSIYDRSASV
jgi:hypothetical protein